jgi:hypothetical protein
LANHDTAQTWQPEIQYSSEMVEAIASPPVPRTLAETALPELLVEELILKALHARKEMMGLGLADHLGLPFGPTEALLETLKRQKLVHVVRSSEMGSVSAVYSLTEAGEQLASQRIAVNQYSGKAPVPVEQYEPWVRRQQRQRGWLNLSMLDAGLSHLVLTPKLLMRLGPALSSAKSILIYGHPGNGKTLLAESLLNLMSDAVYIPYAIESQGQIVQVFDPQYHKPVAQEASPSQFVTGASSYDQRWCLVRRPLVISGGELTPDALDLGYTEAQKFYTAPLQLKANNGIYLVDDLGRQKAAPHEILNRWIVPMEQGIDYLDFRDGSKLRVPFEAFLIFSTNLDPGKISDEAFLRRIQYKMLLRDPDEAEFHEIFRRSCQALGLEYEASMVSRFIAHNYRGPGKAMRRCHPRDVLGHAVNLIEFHNLPFALTDEILDEAFDSCLLEEEKGHS